ncbi:MAG TPA: hypothetical protein VGB13_00695 [Candidatus Krumholzibacteria bacterium]
MKLSQIQLDTKAIEEGEWRDHPFFDGIQVLVRGSSCEAVEARRRHLLNRRPNRRMKVGDAVIESRKIEALCTAECLLDVKGIDDVTYSVELGREWATDAGMVRFMEGVRELADEIGTAESAAHEDSVQD